METALPALSVSLAVLGILFSPSLLADKPVQVQRYSPSDYEAAYLVEKYDTQIARLSYRLQHDNGVIRFSTSAKVTGFAALFRNDTAEELSILDSRANDALLSYRYRQSGSEKNRNTTFSIDWQDNQGTVSGKYAGQDFELTVKRPIWDPLSVQYALMRDMVNEPDELDYQVIHKGKLKHYHFDLLGEDSLEIDEVFYDAVVLQRQHDNRMTKFWLAKDYQYIPLQIENYRNGELETRIVLDTINIHE